MIKTSGLYTIKSDNSLKKGSLSKPAELLKQALGSLKGPRDEMALLIDNGAAVKIPWKKENSDSEVETDYEQLSKNLKGRISKPKEESPEAEDQEILKDVIELLGQLTEKILSLENRFNGEEKQVTKSEDLEPEAEEIIQARMALKGLCGEFRKYRRN